MTKHADLALSLLNLAEVVTSHYSHKMAT
uniref:Uncharacterized protein n=1 Tax=Anguilla anguilla TaxID=7936 RepID=A0A0E9UEI8_ANGAN